MPKLAANLTMLFKEQFFLDRFAAASSCGFKGVEFLFPYQWSKDQLSNVLAQHNLTPVLFNLPPGDWAAGDRGFAALPGHQATFVDGLEKALDYATAMGCTQLHVMAGVMNTDANDMEVVFIENLQLAARRSAEVGVRLMIEPLNQKDMPGYFLRTAKQAVEIIDKVGSDNLFLQLDIYHQQITTGNLAKTLSDYISYIGHIQIASVPNRHEPDEGEVNYHWLLNHLDELGYENWVGCEYHPKNSTKDGLGWASNWGIKTG